MLKRQVIAGLVAGIAFAGVAAAQTPYDPKVQNPQDSWFSDQWRPTPMIPRTYNAEAEAIKRAAQGPILSHPGAGPQDDPFYYNWRPVEPLKGLAGPKGPSGTPFSIQAERELEKVPYHNVDRHAQ